MNILILLLPIVTSSNFTFEQIPSYGYPTQLSRYSTLIYFSNSLYTFGGGDINTYSNDLRYFSLSTLTWKSIILSTDNVPSPRVDSFGFVYNEEIYIYGGTGKDSLKNDLWYFNTTYNIWKQAEFMGLIPVARRRPSLLVVNDLLFLYGGDTYSGTDSRLFELNLKNFEWKVLVVEGTLEPRAGSALFWYNETLNLWAGSTYDSNLIQINSTTLQILTFPITGIFPNTLAHFPYAVYNDMLITFPGYTYPLVEYNLNCFSLNLISFSILNFTCPSTSIFTAYTQHKEIIYFFGREIFESFTNELSYINLSETLNLTILSPVIKYPQARVDHTMFRCRNFLWVFGGCTEDYFYSDSWKFNVMNEEWEPLPPVFNVPSARCGHKGAHLYGDAYIVFGGYDGTFYYNDFYIYNFVANSWTDISGARLIPGRSKSCIHLVYPNIYVHGGLSSNGVLSDFWRYEFVSSTYEELDTSVDAPALYNHVCVDYSGDFNITILFSGTSITGQTNPFLYIFDRKTHKWSIQDSNSLLSLSNTRFQILNNKVLIIGGSRYYQAEKDILLYDFTSVSLLYTLPKALVSHEMVHIGNKIFIFGGSLTIDRSFFPNIGTSNLYKLSINNITCSQGYYGKDCEICPKGSYNSKFDSDTCELCGPGTYSEGYGLTSTTQCLPCPYGTFNYKYGKNQCLDCGNPNECWFKTIKKRERQKVETVVSVQPDPYKTNKGEVEGYIVILQICMGVAIGLVFILYFFDKKIKVYQKLDIFKEKHKVFNDRLPHKNAYGGLFSLIFGILAIFFILSPVLYYCIANIYETKTLVPGFTLENKEYEAEYLFMSVKLYSYDNCVDPITNECSSIIIGSPNGLTVSENVYLRCKLIEDYCEMSALFKKAIFSNSGYLNMTIRSVLAYTTGLEVFLKISTSLPGKYNESSIKYYIEPPKNYVYNGIYPTIFYIDLIPTVFYCDYSINNCKSNTTGYHINYSKNPTNGSISNSFNINSYNTFSISVVFEKNSNSFVIEWRINVSFFLLISGILGSVSGLIGAVGWSMMFSEKKIEMVKKKLRRIQKLRLLRECRKDFKKNQMIDVGKVEPTRELSDDDPENKKLAVV